MPVLVTGAAGFIGFHVARALLARGEVVVGVDSLNDYYDPALKRARLAELEQAPNFGFERLDLAEVAPARALFERLRPSLVVHLAAQPGVRYSVDHPEVYIQSNLVAFANVLEGCRHAGARHLVYASSSSVYGDQPDHAIAETDPTDQPISLYAATKRSNELIAYSYAHLYGLPSTGLRFFSVYGPWGRPDMAVYLFARAIDAGRPIRVFNHGELYRAFTYIDDAVAAVLRVVDHPPAGQPPQTIYNVGSDASISVNALIHLLEEALGKAAVREEAPMQPGDVHATRADVRRLREALGVAVAVPPEVGIPNFVAWYRQYHAR